MSKLAKEPLNLNDAAITLNAAQISALLEELPGWTLRKVKNVYRIEKRYSFSDFRDALAFTNRVAELADQEDHHPALLTEWGNVTVSWWSHSLGGLHRNDMIMAARTDLLAVEDTLE